MRRLETQSLLQFAAAAVPVLRTLSELHQRMTYKQFGIAIGLVDELLYRFRVGLRKFYGESWTLDVERAAHRIALVITMPSALARDRAPTRTDTFPPSQPETSHA